MSPQDPDTTARSSDHGELQATVAMCYYCFDVLVKETHGSRRNVWRSSPDFMPPVKPNFSLPDTSTECPLFVTWEKKQRRGGGNYELRGCIGTLSPKPLLSSIGHYALTSALKDRRFQPISWKEVPQLRVGVSLLVHYEPCDDCHDWLVGTHGILIEWQNKNDSSSFHTYSATYLPEVARDQNWDQETTVRSLIRKAGYQGAVDSDLLQRIRCTRYQSSKCRVTYEDYVQHLGYDPAAAELFKEKEASSSPPNCHVM